MNRTEEFVTKLCEELRSGKWEQIRHRYTHGGNTACALYLAHGVIAAMRGPTDDSPRNEVIGIGREAFMTIARKINNLNDVDDLSFEQIADRVPAIVAAATAPRPDPVQ